MPLKQDIEASFQKNLDSGGSIEVISDLLVKDYENAVNAGSNSLGNKSSGVKFDIVKTAIIAQFNLSFTTKSFLQFSLIESALVQAWLGSTKILPAVPPPGIIAVSSVTAISSTPPGTLPLFKQSSDFDPIVTAFTEMFTKHALSVTYNYIGPNPSGSPTTVPVPGYTIS